MSIQKNSQIKRNSCVKHTTVDEDIVILGPDDNVYYRLNRVGSRIWSMLELNELTLEAIADNIQRLYKISEEQALQDTTNFIELMMAKNILSWVQ